MRLSNLCLYVFFYSFILLCDAKYDAKEVDQPMNYTQDDQMKLDKIIDLPGQPKVDFDQYAGYVTVDQKNGRALFYYFVESPQYSSKKPLLLWLNGGPGCSSIGTGAMMESGPFRVNNHGNTLIRNNNSWNKVANVLYLDSPAGTGFSYSNTSSDYHSIKEDRIINDSYTFLLNWLKRFPQYITNDFFIAGESNAGRIIPQLAKLILCNNKIKNMTTINLQGIAVGNPVLGYGVDEGKYSLYFNHALIPIDLFQTIKDCNFTDANFDKKCEDARRKIHNNVNKLDRYNIYAPTPDCAKPRNSSEIYNRPDPCSVNYVRTYLNTLEVQKALHANVTNLTFAWEQCSDGMLDFAEVDGESIFPIMQELIAERLNIWIYSGDLDSTIPTLSTRRAIKSLRLSMISKWRPWNNKNEVGGYIEEYEGITFITVKGAGQKVPMDKPEEALIMISYFLEKKLQ